MEDDLKKNLKAIEEERQEKNRLEGEKKTIRK